MNSAIEELQNGIISCINESHLAPAVIELVLKTVLAEVSYIKMQEIQKEKEAFNKGDEA